MSSSDESNRDDNGSVNGDQGSYVRTLDDGDPLPVDRHADIAIRARILRSISRVRLTDKEVEELDARLHGTSRVLRTFRHALAVELARIIAARKDPSPPEDGT